MKAWFLLFFLLLSSSSLFIIYRLTHSVDPNPIEKNVLRTKGGREDGFPAPSSTRPCSTGGEEGGGGPLKEKGKGKKEEKEKEKEEEEHKAGHVHIEDVISTYEARLMASERRLEEMRQKLEAAERKGGGGGGGKVEGDYKEKEKEGGGEKVKEKGKSLSSSSNTSIEVLSPVLLSSLSFLPFPLPFSLFSFFCQRYIIRSSFPRRRCH